MTTSRHQTIRMAVPPPSKPPRWPLSGEHALDMVAIRKAVRK